MPPTTIVMDGRLNEYGTTTMVRRLSDEGPMMLREAVAGDINYFIKTGIVYIGGGNGSSPNLWRPIKIRFGRYPIDHVVSRSSLYC